MPARKRCARSEKGSSELYIDYHDKECGVPVHDDRAHFEFLVLEGAQAGLVAEELADRVELGGAEVSPHVQVQVQLDLADPLEALPILEVTLESTRSKA